jgi:hypothetical protein
MKITRRTKSEAIHICAVAASNPDLTCRYDHAARAIGASGPALKLAFEAWDAVWWATRNRGEVFDAKDPAFDAEAEALLRTGWTPEATA